MSEPTGDVAKNFSGLARAFSGDELHEQNVRRAKARADREASISTCVSALCGLLVIAALLGLVALVRVTFGL